MSGQKNIVLAVDDTPSEIYMYDYFLKQNSQELIDALCGIDTLHTADMVEKAESLLQGLSKEEWPKTIILDGNMPGKDAIDFIPFLIDEGYTGELLICTTSEQTAKQMMDFIEKEKAKIQFAYADTKYRENKDSVMKGKFMQNYFRARASSPQK